MQKKQKIIAIRHGQTDWNAAGRIQGRTDIPLNDTGRQQVQAATLALPNGIDCILASPLQRALETAQIINARYQIPLLTDNRLTERDFGDFEGMSMHELDLPAMRRWTDNLPTPNGETIRDVATRVFACLDSIKKTYAGKTILLVAHAHVVRTIIWYFNGIPDPKNEIVPEIDTSGFFCFPWN